jgi:hypothetical protein
LYVKAVVAGDVASASIPGQTPGTTVQYYVLTTTMPEAQLKSSPDLCTLRLNSSGGTNFSYTVGGEVFTPGEGWHNPAEALQGVTPSISMRTPLAPSAGDAVYVYAGNYQADATGGNMTAGTVHYRLGASGTWLSQAMDFNNEVRDAYTTGWVKNWIAALPTTGYEGGDVLQYVLALAYSDRSTTYIGTTNQTGCVLYATLAEAQAAPFAVTFAAAQPNLGNSWHAPANAEPAGAYMRNPRHPYADNDVVIYNGNQYAGEGGTPGNQYAGTVHYREQGASSWETLAMTFDTTIDNNKYWRGVLPADTFSGTATVEYVLEVAYSDHDTTYLGRSSSGASSEAFATLAEAQAQPFDFTYAGNPGAEPGYIWHGGNAIRVSGDTIQLWAKIGYKQDAFQWADEAEIRYVVASASPGVTRQGAYAMAKTPGRRAADPALIHTVSMTFSHEEWDGSENGSAMWWVGTIQDPALAAAPNTVLRYQIAARKSIAGGGNGIWRLAEYQADGANDQVFEYRMQAEGANMLTVNGMNADYTTSKFFMDEAQNETIHLRAEYLPPAGAVNVQIFSNVGRRDFWNADLDDDGVADAIRPPSGDLVTTETQGYFAAFPMTWDGNANAYVWEADIDKCGAYRLSARYQLSGDSTWYYYSSEGRRDHAVVISPKKVLQQTVYELNALDVKATAATEAGRSTFADLINGADSFDTFGIDYLNKIQANCLWFQPIHTSSEYGLSPSGEPGSPYSAKDYFAVSKWFGRNLTEAGALEEFQAFVQACDAGKDSNMSTSYVGTINIMLDGVFNHTSWDAVFGEMGERMGLVPEGQGSTTAIASLRPGWYANYSDYGAPATFYNGPAGGQHDIACAPDRGDFGKWLDTAELFYGNYAALVRHNPEDNSNYLNEADWYDYSSMTPHTVELWEYMGAYPEFWLEKTGHGGYNQPGVRDVNGILVDDYGIDGLRCDFGQGLPPQFWEYIINRTRNAKWNFMFMAESLDGGNVSYRSNRHFDILNESFVFQMVGAQSPQNVKDALESRRSLYSGSAILLNLTSHDEVMPFEDPWVTASRYAMVSSVMGLPMTFFGQEQGIGPCTADKTGHNPGDSVAGARWNGFAKFELNMGKWVPHFKEWNKLIIWETPPSDDWSRQMAQWYGRVNWARLNSPALQSGNQYFLGRKNEGSYDNGKIFAVAKYEEVGAVANGKDAVLAFTLFVNPGSGGHAGMTETYDLAACADALGIQDSAETFYNVRNLASSQPGVHLWSVPKSGADLLDEGIPVVLLSDDTGHIYGDGRMVQYLKIEEVTVTPPDPTELFIEFSPSVLEVAYQGTAAFTVSVVDDLGNAVENAQLTQVTAVSGSTFTNGVFSCLVTSAVWVGEATGIEFSATLGDVTTSAVMQISVPWDSNGNSMQDAWEWEHFDGFTASGEEGALQDSDGNGISDSIEYIMGTDPHDPTDWFEFVGDSIATNEAAAVSVVVAVKPERVYQMEYADVSLHEVTAADWKAFNYRWTNLPPYVQTREFSDDESEETSGGPIEDIRMYRVKVTLP